MGLTVDDIVAKFPVKVFPPIEGEPDYSTISQLIQGLYGNAASLQTSLGGGLHGHVGLIMPVELYTTLTAIPYEAPDNPGTIPVAAANAAIRDANKARHTKARRIFDNHHNMDDALKTQIIDAVNDVYLCDLRNKYTGY